MISPRKWTPRELQRDAERATAQFRRERLDEPLELYGKFFNAFVPIFRILVAQLPEIAEGDSRALAAIVRSRDTRTAFRYLTAPPISEDDLKTLAETTLSPAALASDLQQAQRVREVVFHVLDPHRFPWVRAARSPDDNERERSVVASAALVAAQKVATERRTSAKKEQENDVMSLLRGCGFKAVPARSIPLLDAAPAPGQFCGESKLGDARADVVVRLRDRRVLPIECKVSNSAVNSVKRINREAAGKAAAWVRAFGERQVVPSAVLSGVFNPTNLEIAQRDGLSLFWAFRLNDLAKFIKQAHR